MERTIRHERIYRRGRGPYGRNTTEHAYHLVLTMRREDVDLLRRLGEGSPNAGMRRLMDSYTALTR